MLMRTDPFQVLDRLTKEFLGDGSPSRLAAMPIDAYRTGDEFVVHFDLPGVSPDAIDVDVQRNVLTVQAERTTAVTGDNVEVAVSERPRGTFTRQLFLGDSLDAENVSADYDAGVLTLRIPVAERAKPRKIAVGGSGSRRRINA